MRGRQAVSKVLDFLTSIGLNPNNVCDKVGPVLTKAIPLPESLKRRMPILRKYVDKRKDIDKK